ncbi:MAG: hypothetical protein HY244_17880, partial [Rhizobiales bacterium]|nr:hypothetical protein [Hyphomicrobiales bacterium]
TAREGLEGGILRHAQIEPEPMRERSEIDRFGNGFAVFAAAGAAPPVTALHWNFPPGPAA